MLVYFLWDIVVQGPGGPETVLLSNVQYYLETGPLAGRSYRASWTTSSASGFYLDKGSANLTPHGVIKSGGIVPRNVPALVFDNALLPESNVREWDHLFGPGYTLEGSVIGKSAVVDVGDPPPALGDFDEFFTGKLSKKPTRDSTAGTVTFYPQPTVDDTNGPLATRTFNGMARYGEVGVFVDGVAVSDAPATGPAPDIYASGDFTLQFYGSMDKGASTTPESQILVLKDGALNVLLAFGMDTADETYKIGVARAGGADIYPLYDATGVLLEDFNFLTVTWDAGVGNINAWWNDEHVVVDEPILNTPTGVPVTSLIGLKSDLEMTIHHSAVRVWSRALSEQEVLARLGAIEHESEVSLELAIEADRGVGNALIDDSGKGNHLLNPEISPGVGVVNWQSRNDGESTLLDKTFPVVLGTVFSAPVTMDDTRFADGLIGANILEITQVFALGHAFAKIDEEVFDGVAVFNSLTMSILLGDFGRFFVIGQRISVSDTTIYDGLYRVVDVRPNRLYALRKIGLAGTVELFVEYVDDAIADWPLGSTESALIVAVGGDYNIVEAKDPYGLPSNTDLKSLHYQYDPVSPAFANVIGEDKLLVTDLPVVPALYYLPVDTLGNALLIALKEHGPLWDDTTLPPVPYGTLTDRVGYYVNSRKPTREVIDDLAGGCQVWVKEDGDGVVSFQGLLFPEEHAGPAEVIDKGSVINVRELTERDGRSALSSLVVQYSESVVTMEGSSIPDGVDPEVRAYIASKWRTVTVGAADKATTETPTIDLYVQEKATAQVIGERVLRLSQGSVFEVRMTMSAAESMDAFEVGALVNADLPTFSMPNAVGISLGAKPFPLKTSGSEIVVHFWTE